MNQTIALLERSKVTPEQKIQPFRHWVSRICGVIEFCLAKIR
jgi:hypothetical protein